MPRLQARVVLLLTSLIMLVGCRGSEEPIARTIECGPGTSCIVFTGEPALGTTDPDGMVVFGSPAYDVAYELTFVDGDGAPMPGLEVTYEERPNKMSLIVVVDPTGLHETIVIYGRPDFIAGLTVPASLGLETPSWYQFGSDSASGHQVQAQAIPLVLGVIFVAVSVAAATKVTLKVLGEAATAATYFDREGLLIGDNYIEFCRTTPEILAMQRQRIEVEKGNADVGFSLITLAAGLIPGAEPVTVALDIQTLRNEGVIDVAYDIIDWFRDETGYDVPIDQPIRARIYITESMSTYTSWLLAPIEVESFDCDPQEYVTGETSLLVTHNPEHPAAFQDVYVTATLDPPSAEFLVVFDAKGTDGYRQENTASTNGYGQVSFYVPGGAAGVMDEYVMYVPTLGLTAYDTVTFGASASSTASPAEFLHAPSTGQRMESATP